MPLPLFSRKKKKIITFLHRVRPGRGKGEVVSRFGQNNEQKRRGEESNPLLFLANCEERGGWGTEADAVPFQLRRRKKKEKLLKFA